MFKKYFILFLRSVALPGVIAIFIWGTWTGEIDPLPGILAIFFLVAAWLILLAAKTNN